MNIESETSGMSLSYSFASVGDLIDRQSQPVDQAKTTLFSTFKNEIQFCPAFFVHYRSIGFEQFLIIDDNSDDGTYEWLLEQDDVCVLRMNAGYGEELDVQLPSGAKKERAGIFFKMALPHFFFENKYVAYFDADEFLVLPPSVKSVNEVIDRLVADGQSGIFSSVVEFFPAEASGLEGEMPEEFSALLEAYPFFQQEKLIEPTGGIAPKFVGESKTYRLFERYGIKPRVFRKGFQKIWMSKKEKEKQKFQKSPRHKTPILLRSDDSYLVGTHNANIAPAQNYYLTVIHFVFTANFPRKIENAVKWGSHANSAAKYKYYAELLNKISGTRNGFLDENSVRFKSAKQFLDCGLMRW